MSHVSDHKKQTPQKITWGLGQTSSADIHMKGIIHLKMIIPSSFTYPHIIKIFLQNIFFVFSRERKSWNDMRVS